jgi:hypothetical protein
MRSWILSAALGLGSLGVLAVTPDDAQAGPWRGRSSSYYAGSYYGGYSYAAPYYGYSSGYSYAAPMTSYSTTSYYAPPTGVVASPSGASYYYSPGTGYYSYQPGTAYYAAPVYPTYYGSTMGYTPYYGVSRTGYYTPNYYRVR